MQKGIIAVLFFVFSFIGFLVKLPTAFRHQDKELHTAFYFGAALLLNVLFSKRNFLRHLVIFGALFLFGVAIERAQGASNKLLHQRIHGRFDPVDIAWNVRGLIAFSILWILYVLIVSSRRRVSSPTSPS